MALKSLALVLNMYGNGYKVHKQNNFKFYSKRDSEKVLLPCLETLIY